MQASSGLKKLSKALPAPRSQNTPPVQPALRPVTPPPESLLTAPAIYESDLVALERAVDSAMGGLTTPEFLDRLFAGVLEEFSSGPKAARAIINRRTEEFIQLYDKAMDYRLILSENWTTPMAAGVCNYKHNVKRIRALEDDLGALTDDLEMAQVYVFHGARSFKEHLLEHRSFIYQTM